nr:unnamed protein product [Callosobruchus chinensis]
MVQEISRFEPNENIWIKSFSTCAQTNSTEMGCEKPRGNLHGLWRKCKGYRIYIPVKSKIEFHRDVTFSPNKLPSSNIKQEESAVETDIAENDKEEALENVDSEPEAENSSEESDTVQGNETDSFVCFQLVSQPASQPLGDLALLDCADEDDNAVLHRIKRLATAHLPEVWRNWKVFPLSRKDILGAELDPQILSKIRFALPTVGLLQAFYQSAKTISEKKYRDLKFRMLDWPFCVGLIMGPPSVSSRIRGTAAQHELFLAAIAELKPLLISRKVACLELAADSSDVDGSSSLLSVPQDSDRPPKKSSRLDMLEQATTELRSMMEVILDRLPQKSAEGHISTLSNENAEDAFSDISLGASDQPSLGSWVAPSLGHVPMIDIDLTPRTLEQEPLIPAPKAAIEAQGIECQRFGQPTFNRILYADVQKKLHAAPVFSALQINQQIKHLAPSPASDILTKSDMSFGLICHGLLLQREALSKSLREIGAKFPDAVTDIQRLITDSRSEFRSVSDDLLQYTCGRRAEIIELRRKAFRPRSDYMASLLLAIPPSPSYLFEERALAELLRSHPDLFFRGSSSQIGSQTKRAANASASNRFKSGRYSSSGSRHSRKTPSGVDGPVGRKRRSLTSNDVQRKRFRGGQLSDFSESWKLAGAPQSILQTISAGYTIPFVAQPPLIRFSDSLLKRFAFPGLHQEIQLMLQQGILEVSRCQSGFLSRMFAVAMSDGGVRPVLNLKRLNAYLHPKKFRLLNHLKVPTFLQPNDFLVKLDLSQAYFHVPMQPRHRRFLSIVYKDQILQWTCLPFGLASAPLAFARLSNWVASRLRDMGLKIIVYLDDFLLAHQDPVILQEQAEQAITFLMNLGPSLEYGKKYGSASTPQAEGSEARSSEVVVKSFLELGDRKKDSRKIEEMRWWLKHLGASSGIFPRSPDIFMSWDASEKGWGAQIGDKFLSGLWTREQLQWHISVKELMAISLSLQLSADTLMGKTVVVQSDSRTVVSYIRKQGGTRSRLLTSVVDAQQHRGLFIPGQGIGGLETIRPIGSPDFPKVGHSRDRPVCVKGFQGSKSICLKRHDKPRSSVYGCVQSPLEFQPCLDFSPASSGTESPLSPQLRSGDLHFGGAEMGEGLLETRSEEQSYGSTHSNLQCKSPPAGKSDGQASPAISQNIFGGMENTWWASATKDWPQEDRSLLEKAWRRSTLRTYSSPWKQWLVWYAKIKSDPMKPEAGVLAQYLSFLFRVKRFAPTTIRVHKSVIVSLVDPVRGDVLAASSLVRHMVKAIEVSCSSSMGPAKVIWDVNLLISWLKNEVLDESSLYQVSRRLSLILLLASGRRIHDLTLLRIDSGYMTLRDGYVCFWPSFGSKTDRNSHRQSGWKLLKVEDRALDPVHWSSKLLEVSASRRAARENLFNVFITTRGKVGPASRSIIAGWVQSAFRSAGINFPPGSIRSAVASTRRKDHLPLDTILQCGNWTGEGNVFRYYFKEIQAPQTVQKTTLVSDYSFVPV